MSTVALLAALLVMQGAIPSATTTRHFFIVAATAYGDPVRDLRPGDLQVQIGEAHPTVRSVTAGRPSGASGIDRTILFLLDEAHFGRPQLPAVKQIVTWLAEDTSAGAAFAVWTTEGRARLAETTDPAQVADALQRLDAGFARSGHFQIDNESRDSTVSLVQSRMDENALDGLRRAAESFRDDGRRHIVVWLTSSFWNIQWTSRAERTAAALLDHGVSVYAINAATAIPLAKDGLLDMQPEEQLAYGGQRINHFRPLLAISDRCAGFALIGGRPLRGGLNRLVNELNNYYDVEIDMPPLARAAFLHVSSSRSGVVIRAPERLPSRH